MTTMSCCTPEHHIDMLLGRSNIDPAGCWTWKQRLDKDGYGAIWHKGRSHIRAHRFAYEALMDEIPDGLVIDHLCRNRACVNPEHLEPVDTRTNSLRGWGVQSYNARKTKCPFDWHPTYDVVNAKGDRGCPTCNRLKKQERRARNRLTGLAATDPRHGTDAGYTDYGCRCEACRTYKKATRKDGRSGSPLRQQITHPQAAPGGLG